MNGACVRESLVYYATISCNDKNYQPKLYKGSCETSFKKRYSNHKKSFNVPLYKHDTKLSTENWKLYIYIYIYIVTLYAFVYGNVTKYK